MKICAVVVTYNRSSLMLECVEALKLQNDLSGIIIINNASTDKTKQILDDMSCDLIHVVHMAQNTGGAGGFYQGLKYSVEMGYDVSWIMDDDAIPQDGALSKLVNAAQIINWDFGFLTSNVMTPDGECMNAPSIDFRPNSTGYPDWAKLSELNLIKVRIATFASVFIKNSVIKNIGLPIKEMFIWGDDSEYTQRVSNTYESYFVPSSKVVHKRVSASTLSVITESNPDRLKWFEFFYRNNLYRFRKHESKKATAKLFFHLILTLSAIILKAKSHKTKRILKVLKGTAKGLFFNPVILYPAPDLNSYNNGNDNRLTQTQLAEKHESAPQEK